jgi:hypothetical protein
MGAAAPPKDAGKQERKIADEINTAGVNLILDAVQRS